MAIPIDRVYRTVQKILNIEQRGQLPPSDFNDFASLAQLDLFNKLFYDLEHFKASQKGVNGELPMDIQEKIDVFYKNIDLVDAIGISSTFFLPETLYSLTTVYHTDTKGVRRIVEKIDHSGSQYILNSPLTRPREGSLTFPKYVRLKGSFSTVDGANTGNGQGIGSIQIYPTFGSNISIDYVDSPSAPLWNSITISSSETPFYDSSSSNDFDLHPSQEDDLIRSILFYAGISIKQEAISTLIKNADSTMDVAEKS